MTDGTQPMYERSLSAREADIAVMRDFEVIEGLQILSAAVARQLYESQQPQPAFPTIPGGVVSMVERREQQLTAQEHADAHLDQVYRRIEEARRERAA